MANKNTKKAFADVPMERVYANVDSATGDGRKKWEHDAVTPEEAAERLANMNTQGAKGCKAARINMAVSPDNYEFIRVMARLTGKTLTGFVNYALDQYREEHSELYKEVKEFFKKL